MASRLSSTATTPRSVVVRIRRPAPWASRVPALGRSTALNAPVPAAKKVLAKAGLTLDDIDLFEVNEAFAVVTEKFIRDLDLDRDKVNVNGGAMALGHPIGATGSMLIGTVLDELERQDKQFGLVTMCAAGGMAPAVIIERICRSTGGVPPRPDLHVLCPFREPRRAGASARPRVGPGRSTFLTAPSSGADRSLERNSRILPVLQRSRGCTPSPPVASDATPSEDQSAARPNASTSTVMYSTEAEATTSPPATQSALARSLRPS